MAALSSLDLAAQTKAHHALVAWTLFDLIKHLSFTVRILRIPISISVARCEPVIELMVGPRPDGASA